MRTNLSTFLLKTVIWMLCLHSMSFGSIITPSSLATLVEKLLHQKASSMDPPSTVLKRLRQARNSSVSWSEAAIARMATLETNLGWRGIHVVKGGPEHGQLIANAVDSAGFDQVLSAFIGVKASQNFISNECFSRISDDMKCAQYLSKLSMYNTVLQSDCKKYQTTCSKQEFNSEFRSMDGSCNNQLDGNLGRSFTGYRRVLFPAYADGIAEPRTRSGVKKLLPSARHISVNLAKDVDRKDNSVTLAAMQWSEFISHDLMHTASSKMLYSRESIMCCDESGRNLAPRYIHPFCFPIGIASDDPVYFKHYMGCMSYVRSLPAIRNDCTFGPLNQMNQVSHFLDASQIYGSTSKKARKLRELSGGRLLVSLQNEKQFLPLSADPTEDCQLDSKKNECYRSGDVRVNMHPQLTIMVILWYREHNRIANQLAKINPEWDDERLYQETRRIVVAEIQHITYDEWLAVVLGEKLVSKLNLNKYDPNIDAAVSNSFATAAIRFTSSQIENDLKLYDESRHSNKSLRLHEHFNRPDALGRPGHFDGLIRGLATQPSQKIDLMFASDVTEHFYSPEKTGYDALSLDIKRGRDHGLPTYIEFRKLCGLSKVERFEDLSDYTSPETIKTLSSLYSLPSDIDLIVGGLAEKPFHDSLLGPTFTCLVAEQMYRSRLGDRYYYTNKNAPKSLTNTQVQEIEKTSLAAVFCDNGDDIQTMQPKVFNAINEKNKLVDCADIPRMDLNAWKA